MLLVQQALFCINSLKNIIRYLSKDKIVDIKFAIFMKKGKKLISFIELKIDELENCIKDMEEYIEEYENI